MKKLVVAAIVMSVLYSGIGCVKNESCKEKTVESEENAILNYATLNGITPVRHSSGLYYQVVSPGSGGTPTLTSTVKANYVGKLMDGTIFDQSTAGPVTFALSNTIYGWQLGLPLVQKGGVIKLIIPSSLAYGCNGFNTIPPYSILYFQVELVDIL
ncbi:MAG: FKBP-type peptidyl-prolyl cis-trans isomerase [Chitinophagaceae bacterium]|nr:FKBP-type peptidyl-prolyl cis-trans isomerase [Chitinophagaceae bacterium]MBK8952863.1 FKBP-type peptidyl-prolyl cis-trans isomerase [Chitinophagaceae bacterium]